MKSIAFLFCFGLLPNVFASSINPTYLKFLHKLELDKLDSLDYDSISFEGLVETDQDLNSMIDLKQAHFTLFNDGAKSRILQVVTSSRLEFIDDSNTRFIKDPTLTFLVLLQDDDKLDVIKELSPGLSQAYFFAAQISEGMIKLFEIQKFCKSLVQISSMNLTTEEIIYMNQNVWERRSDLKGLALKGSLIQAQPYYWYEGEERKGYFGEVMTLFQARFNFTLDLLEWKSYGTLSSNGTWTGAVSDLVSNKMDFRKN